MEGVIIVSILVSKVNNLGLMHFVQGFDEYMNVVLDNACEVYVKTGTRKSVGRAT